MTLPPGVQPLATARRVAQFEERRSQLRHMGYVNETRVKQQPLFGSNLRALLLVCGLKWAEMG